MHFTIIPFAADLALPLGPYSHISCRLYVTIHCFVFEKFIAISCYFTFASTRNIWLSAVWLSATPIISGNFQTHARRAHLSSDLILYACSNIHISEYRLVPLSADISRPPYAADSRTFFVGWSVKLTSYFLSLTVIICTARAIKRVFCDNWIYYSILYLQILWQNGLSAIRLSTCEGTATCNLILFERGGRWGDLNQVML